MSTPITTTMGCLKVNGSPIDFSSSPVSYSSGLLELLASSSENKYNIIWEIVDNPPFNYLVSTKNILVNISYATLLQQGFVKGDYTVTLNNTLYKVRLFTSDEWNSYIRNDINLNSLYTPTTMDISGTYDSNTISTSLTNSLLNWYGISSFTNTTSGNNVTIRGGTNIGTTSAVSTTSTSSTVGLRLVLEKYNQPPTITSTSYTFGSIGSYSSYPEYLTFVISDPEDLFSVNVKIDGSTSIWSLMSQPSGTSFTVSLSNVWSSLSSNSNHSIDIQVQDVYGNIVTKQWIFYKLDTTSVGTSTTLVRPVITKTTDSTRISPLNPSVDNIFTFSSSGGGLIYANEFYIRTNDANATVVYDKKITTYKLSHTIPSGTLTAGTDYQIKCRTYDSNGQYSEWSDIVLAKALSNPIIIITSIINGQVTTQNPIFQSTFYQAEDDTLKTYEYILYKDGVQIETSGELTDKLLYYQCSGLENKTTYTVKLLVYTTNGLEASISQDFYVIYEQSRMSSVVNLTNEDSIGGISIEIYARQILGRLYSGNDPTYEDDEWINLHDSVIIIDSESGFSLDGNWTCKLYAKDLEDNGVMLIKFSTSTGDIILAREGNLFLLYKLVDSVKLYQLIKYIDGDILSDDQFMFFIQNDYDNGLMNFDVKRVTDGRTTWFTKSDTDDVAPSYANTEDGFLSQLDENFVKVLQDVTIDNETMKVYIPSVDDFSGVASVGTSAKIGQLVIGQSVVGDTSTNIVNIMLADNDYFTRDILTTDVNKLVVINSTGSKTNAYPNDINTGIRIMVDISSTTKVSTIQDSDNSYYLALSILNLFDIQNISDMKIGDKVKSYSLKYDNEVIKFTILKINTTNSTVTLISDCINTTKIYDTPESVYVNGNPNWNLSNLKQWLNSDTKLG